MIGDPEVFLAPGAPCFVGVICPDDGGPATAFYAALFGWEFDDIADGGDPPSYVAGLADDRVANLAGSGNGEPGVWITAVSVADRQVAADAVNAAGGSARGTVANTRPAGGASPAWVPDFEVTDLADALEVAAAHGGRVVIAPQGDGSSRRATLSDPGGAQFTVSERLEVGAPGPR